MSTLHRDTPRSRLQVRHSKAAQRALSGHRSLLIWIAELALGCSQQAGPTRYAHSSRIQIEVAEGQARGRTYRHRSCLVRPRRLLDLLDPAQWISASYLLISRLGVRFPRGALSDLVRPLYLSRWRGASRDHPHIIPIKRCRMRRMSTEARSSSLHTRSATRTHRRTERNLGPTRWASSLNRDQLGCEHRRWPGDVSLPDLDHREPSASPGTGAEAAPIEFTTPYPEHSSVKLSEGGFEPGATHAQRT